MLTVTQTPLDLHALRYERLLGDSDRTMVARHVLAIVAAFAGRDDTCADAIAGAVTCEPGEAPHEAAERQVRDLAPRAERATLRLTGRLRHSDDVVMEILIAEHLDADYRRIVRVEQHRAFDHPLTSVERRARKTRREQDARDIAEAAAAAERRRLKDLRVCRCGSNYGQHRPRSGWQTRPATRTRQCYGFRHVEESPIAHLDRPLMEMALVSWVARAGQTWEPELAGHAMTLLEQMRAAGKGRDLLLGEAILTAVAALGHRPS